MTTKEQLENERAELKAKVDEIDVMLREADAKYRAYDQKLQQEGLSEDLKFLFTAAERDRVELRLRRDPLLARITELEKLIVDVDKFQAHHEKLEWLSAGGKRSYEQSNSSSQVIEAVTGPAAKRVQLIPFISFDVDYKNHSSFPTEVYAAVKKLFYGGLHLDELSMVGNPPKHHQIKVATDVPVSACCPSENTPEEIVVYFLCFLIAVLVGKEFVVHDIHTRRDNRLGSPDIAITAATWTEIPRLAETANVIFELKKKELFGTPEHLLQAARYAAGISKNFGFDRCFVVLASQTQVLFMKLEYHGQDPIFYKSDPMELSFHQDVPSNGLLALRAFILQARGSMEVAKMPTLLLSSDPRNTFDLNPKDCELLAVKTSSLIHKVLKSGSSFALKHVTSRVEFDAELAALKTIAPHRNIVKCVASDIPLQYLLLEPLGSCALSHFLIAKNILQFMKMMPGLLEGLDHVHSQGWIHRDIRPENIIYCAMSKNLVLIDFGLAVKGRVYSSREYVGYRMFAPENHLDQLANVPRSSWMFEWSTETDRKALFRVARFVTNIKDQAFVNESFDRYLETENKESAKEVPNTENIKQAFSSFIAERKMRFPELELTSLEAAFK